MDKAEAVLLALGPILQWCTIAPGFPGVYASLLPKEKEGLVKQYRCDKREPQGLFRAMVSNYRLHQGENRTSHVCPNNFATLDAAKAACERHHAIGKWE